MEKELQEIKAMLGNVMTKKKNDETLKTTIKDTMLEMKDEILKSLTHRIDMVEGDLHDRAKEIDTLKKDVDNLKKTCAEQKAEDETLREEIENSAKKNEKLVNQRANELEQYQRPNNIRISGIKDSAEEKNCFQTTEAVCYELNRRTTGLSLSPKDIDIAHRLGKYKDDLNRNIIVSFMSRGTKICIFKKQKTTQRSWHIY